jgi:hypothetical protein
VPEHGKMLELLRIFIKYQIARINDYLEAELFVEDVYLLRDRN